MDWLGFLIGVWVGWLICWLIDYLFCRRRRAAAEAELDAKLARCNDESAALGAQLTGYKDLQVRLDVAQAEIGTLKTQLAHLQDVQVRLDGATVELDALKAQAGGTKDLHVRLEAANAELDSLKAQLAGMKSLQADLVSWKVQATEKGLEIEHLNAELAPRMSAGTAAAATGVVAAADMSARTAVAAAETGVVAVADTSVSAGSLDMGVAGLTTAAPAAGIALTTQAAQPAEPDDLTVIEGIGPKINKLMNGGGIYTFAQLAAASVEVLRSILSAAGPRFRLADPGTWPEQAAFARDGKWDALQAFQDTLKGGRVV